MLTCKGGHMTNITCISSACKVPTVNNGSQITARAGKRVLR